MRVVVVGALLALLAAAPPASAQEPYNLDVQVTELSQIFKQLYGPGGLVVNSLTPLPSGATHSSHFNSGFESEFSQFGTALTSQIVSLPLPPPASGFTYQFDPGLGVFSRTTTRSPLARSSAIASPSKGYGSARRLRPTTSSPR